MRVPAVPAIADAMDLSRALRPLKRWVARPRDVVLAEEATATTFGETRADHASVGASPRALAPGRPSGGHQRVNGDLAANREQNCARCSNATALSGTSAPGRSTVTSPHLASCRSVGPRQARQSSRTLAAEFVDPGGRRAVLILTDAVGRSWQDGTMMPHLLTWAQSCPLAIIQVLSRRLWHRTGLDIHPVTGVMRPGARPPFRVLNSGGRTADSLPSGAPTAWVPVLYLDSAWLRPWAAMVAGSSEKPVRMFAAPLYKEQSTPARRPVHDQDFPADERLRIFQENTASAEVLELAGYLAAAPLSLPIMRLVQHAMVPQSGPDHLAEVFLSGLLVRANPADDDGDPDAVLYDFREGVREKLLGGLTRRDSLRVLDVLAGVSDTIAKRFGTILDFRVLASRATAGPDALPTRKRALCADRCNRFWKASADPTPTLREPCPTEPTGALRVSQKANGGSAGAAVDSSCPSRTSEFRSAISDDLTRIDLSNRELTAVPDWVRKFINLTVLDLSGNQLTLLPEWIGELVALTSLDLSHNHLSAVSDSIGELLALTSLDLSHNRLSAVPDAVRNLSRLTSLILDDMAANGWDAFLLYGDSDAIWVRTLAENLERLGLRVFLDAWESVAGDLIAVRLQEGLAAAGAVVFVVSAESVGRGWFNKEFAAAAATTAGRGKLIPVLAGELAPPPLVASQVHVDFRYADDPVGYEARVRNLAVAIRGQPERRPSRDRALGLWARQVRNGPRFMCRRRSRTCGSAGTRCDWCSSSSATLMWLWRRT